MTQLEKIKERAPKVAVFMGSASDEKVVAPCVEVLKSLDISFYFTVTSAHRTPERTQSLIYDLEKEGCQVYICAAGMAAHLAGVVAAHTLKPVIGIPVDASPLNGMDALLATLQMPPGFPVATVALDKAGAKNAAYLAAQMLALSDPELTKKLQAVRSKFITDVENAGSEIEEKYC